LFGFASDDLMDQIGLDAAGRKATGHTFYALETHLNYLLEVKQGAAVEVRTHILGMDSKRVDVYHTLHLQGADAVLAANQQMLINIDSSGPEVRALCTRCARQAASHCHSPGAPAAPGLCRAVHRVAKPRCGTAWHPPRRTVTWVQPWTQPANPSA